MRRRALFALGTLTLATLGLAACAPRETVDPKAEQAAQDLAWLQENKPKLDELNQELQSIRDRLDGSAPAEEEAGEEGEPMTPEQLEGRATALGAEIETLNEQIGAKVVSFINNSDIELNDAQMIEGEVTPDQQFVIDMRIDQDIAIAQEYIDEGGDYRRAIEIYQISLKLDPDNERLLGLIAEAEELRWMTEERFSQVKKKMTLEEVRGLLGQVHHRNVQEYPEKNRIGWFYKKEEGGAAGVFFKKKGDGWIVESTDFKAVEQQVVESGG